MEKIVMVRRQEIDDLRGRLEESEQERQALEASLARRETQLKRTRRELRIRMQLDQSRRLLVRLAILLSGTLIVANFAALKIWRIGNIPVDGGLILFPITYIVGDLLIELYSRQIANGIAAMSAAMGVLAWLTLWVSDVLLPDYPGADNSAFNFLVVAAGRTFISSIISFFFSQIINNYAFEVMRRKLGESHPYWTRALTSSIVAHLVDAVVFETCAFWGRLPFKEFLLQASFAYVAGLILEAILCPLGSWIVSREKRRRNSATR